MDLGGGRAYIYIYTLIPSTRTSKPTQEEGFQQPLELLRSLPGAAAKRGAQQSGAGGMSGPEVSGQVVFLAAIERDD